MADCMHWLTLVLKHEERILTLVADNAQLRQQLALHTTGFDDGVYAGTREDWITRAEAAETKVDDLKQQLATAEDEIKALRESNTVLLRNWQEVAEELGPSNGVFETVTARARRVRLASEAKEAEIRAAFEAGVGFRRRKGGYWSKMGYWFTTLDEAFAAWKQSRQPEQT